MTVCRILILLLAYYFLDSAIPKFSLDMMDNQTTSLASDYNLFIESKICKKEYYKSTIVKDLYSCVQKLNEDLKKHILITGGAGFVGSHLVDSLMLEGHRVTAYDNFLTGRKANIEHWIGHPNFRLIKKDVIEPIIIDDKIDCIYHLASPASPIHYLNYPIETIKANTIGTINLLEFAHENNARLIFASTSEIYGDPKVHPQVETYWGNVNPIGPRSCYDESKRLAESLVVAYASKKNVSTGIARIFNTYGPRMQLDDGRVISNLIAQVIQNEPMTVYGDGLQTRSFQYITDLIDGLRKLMAREHVPGPVNLGMPEEQTIIDITRRIKSLLPNSSSDIVHKPLPIDDPHRRRPDIRYALEALSWQPSVDLDYGLKRTIDYINQELAMNKK